MYCLDNQGLWVTDLRLLGLELRVRVSGKPMTMIMQLNVDNTAVEVYCKKGKKKKIRVSPFGGAGDGAINPAQLQALDCHQG